MVLVPLHFGHNNTFPAFWSRMVPVPLHTGHSKLINGNSTSPQLHLAKRISANEAPAISRINKSTSPYLPQIADWNYGIEIAAGETFRL